jgi:hypothetical protein
VADHTARDDLRLLARPEGILDVSIKPPSDLLLDVARAADPLASAAAAERLAKIGGQTPTMTNLAFGASPQFSAVMDEVRDMQAPPGAGPALQGSAEPEWLEENPAEQSSAAASPAVQNVALQTPAAQAAQAAAAQPSAEQIEAAAPLLRPRFSHPPADADKKAYQGLEALLLQNVVETMMPESSEFFGEGSAGAIWRSMLAEELGTDLAKKMDLGIMPKYLRTVHHPNKHEPVTAAKTETAINDIRNLLSKPT